MRAARLALPSLAVVLIAASVAAQMPTSPPGKPDPKAVVAGTYTIESSHTQVRFEYLHLGFNPYFGDFSDIKGTLVLDPAKPAAASVEITIPIDSIHVPSAKLVEEFKSPQFFDSAKFPTATFKSTKITVTGTKAKIEGSFTLHGVTKPLTLDASFVGTGAMRGKQTIGFTATAWLKRSDYGIAAAVPLVADDVKIDITAAFDKPV
jgi:polyisoprenoid-binding protein YceI